MFNSSLITLTRLKFKTIKKRTCRCDENALNAPNVESGVTPDPRDGVPQYSVRCHQKRGKVVHNDYYETLKGEIFRLNFITSMTEVHSEVASSLLSHYSAKT